jgi:hypothetical protein
MKIVMAVIAALLVVVLIAGCTSREPIPPDITVQAPGPVVTQSEGIIPVSTVLPGGANISPDTGASGNSTINDVFFLEPVRNYHVGDNITIQGTTILSAGDPLLVEVVSSSFGPAPKSTSQSFTGVSGITTVQKGPPGRPNLWSFSFATGGFINDTYIVTVSGITIDVRDSTTFLLEPRI